MHCWASSIRMRGRTYYLWAGQSACGPDRHPAQEPSEVLQLVLIQRSRRSSTRTSRATHRRHRAGPPGRSGARLTAQPGQRRTANCGAARPGQAVASAEQVIEREQVIALLFDVSDIAVALTDVIKRLWKVTMAKKKRARRLNANGTPSSGCGERAPHARAGGALRPSYAEQRVRVESARRGDLRSINDRSSRGILPQRTSGSLRNESCRLSRSAAQRISQMEISMLRPCLGRRSATFARRCALPSRRRSRRSGRGRAPCRWPRPGASMHRR